MEEKNSPFAIPIVPAAGTLSSLKPPPVPPPPVPPPVAPAVTSADASSVNPAMVVAQTGEQLAHLPNLPTGNAQPTPVAASGNVPDPVDPTQTSVWGTMVEESVELSGFAKIVVGFVGLAAVHTCLFSLASLGFLVFIDRMTGELGFPTFFFLHFFQGSIAIPILFVITTMVLVATVIKLRDGSRQSWIGGLLVLGVLPLILAFVAPLFAMPLVSLFHAPQYARALMAGIVTVDAPLIQLIFAPFAVYAASCLGLLIAYGEFRSGPRELAEKDRGFLVATGLFYAMPVLFFITYAYLRANVPFFLSSQIAKQSKFMVYTPKTFVPGLRYMLQSQGTNRELAGKTDAVEFVYAVQFPGDLQKQEKMITVKEARPPLGFAVEDFLRLLSEDTRSRKTVPVAGAKNQTGTVVTSSEGKYFIYLSTDETLMLFRSKDATADELVEFASVFQ